MLTGRRRAKRTHRWARDLGQDIAAIRQDRLCLVTLCTDEELARDSPGFQARVAAEVACREHLPVADKRRPPDTRAFDELIARLVARIEREDMRVVVHCNGGKGRGALVAAAVLIGLKVPYAKAVGGVRAARPGSLRNPLQLWFLRSFARRWKSASKPPIPKQTLYCATDATLNTNQTNRGACARSATRNSRRLLDYFLVFLEKFPRPDMKRASDSYGV